MLEKIPYGGTGKDWLRGGDDNDKLYGESADRLYEKLAMIIQMAGKVQTNFMEDGNDDLYGGSSSDKLYVGDGEDDLYGGTSADKLYGQDGDDYLDGGSVISFMRKWK